MPGPDEPGLTCPWCGYDLRTLSSNHCPECGKRFVLAKPSMANVTRRRFRSFRLSPSGGSSGLDCPNCGFVNEGFMPRQCKRCGHKFTWWQRAFGTRFQIW